MKYFSLALALFVCVAATSAAPSAESFEELAFNPLDKINEKLKEYYHKFLCARDVIEKSVDKTEFQHDFEEFKEIVDTVMVDWKMCAEEKTKMDYFKCKLEVVKALPEYFGEFFQTINHRNAKLAEKIREKVVKKCFVAEETFEFEDTVASTVADQFQCLVGVLEKVSKDNGMEELWSRTQPIMQRHIDNLKGCSNTENKFKRFICNVREIFAIYKSYIEYVQMVAQQNPKALQDIMRGIQQKCAGQKFDASDVLLKKDHRPEGVIEKLKCVVRSIEKAVEKTPFEAVFAELKRDLEKVGDRMLDCKNESSKLEGAKCLLEQIKKTNSKLLKFLENLALTNRDAFDLAKEYIQKKCA